MSDWVGLGFFVILIIGIFAGLKVLSKPQKRTAEEFERNAAEATTGIGAIANALQEAIDPAAAKAKIVVTEMQHGRYQKKKREGKAGGEAEAGDED
ncbi:MAG: hypothetical protein QM785_15140 [Pyrinomonadaceae bacterium]